MRNTKNAALEIASNNTGQMILQMRRVVPSSFHCMLVRVLKYEKRLDKPPPLRLIENVPCSAILPVKLLEALPLFTPAPMACLSLSELPSCILLVVEPMDEVFKITSTYS